MDKLTANMVYDTIESRQLIFNVHYDRSQMIKDVEILLNSDNPRKMDELEQLFLIL